MPLSILPPRGVFVALLFPLLSVFASAAPSVVTLVNRPDGGWSLVRDGQPFVINGVGGSTALDLAREIGATTIRTWGIEQLDPRADGRSLLDDAHERGLTVMAGIWLQHERHGFSYSDKEKVRRQRDEVLAAVRRHKNHPALLIWGLGNEMEGPTESTVSPAIGREIEYLARLVKQEDPNHPICTVIAGASAAKIRAMAELAPSVDILGVNAYGGAAGVGGAVVAAGWTKPFILAEYGPVGHWEVAQTSWGAPIEPLAREKAANYYISHRGAVDDGGGRCVGTFAFVWGHKQETTATWYGMFLPTGEKTPAVDAMAYAWSGQWPKNRSPRLQTIKAGFDQGVVSPGEALVVEAEARDPDGDPLAYDWQVVSESTDRRVGGDAEAAPPFHPECVVRAEGPRVELRAPKTPGAYRVFLYLRDGEGGGSADNFPFLVK